MSKINLPNGLWIDTDEYKSHHDFQSGKPTNQPNMKTPNHIWVKYPKMFNETIETKSGLILSKINDYKPEWNAILNGEVAVLAPHISPTLGIDDEILIGDRVYFHYLVADEENILEEGGEKYLRVPVYKIFCLVRAGKIIPYGGHVLAKPVYSDDIQDVDVDGKKVMAKVTKSGLVTEVNVGYIKNSSEVFHIGKPLKGEPELGVEPGDIVVMDKHSHNEYEIEGETYHIYEQRDLLCITSKSLHQKT